MQKLNRVGGLSEKQSAVRGGVAGGRNKWAWEIVTSIGNIEERWKGWIQRGGQY